MFAAAFFPIDGRLSKRQILGIVLYGVAGTLYFCVLPEIKHYEYEYTAISMLAAYPEIDVNFIPKGRRCEFLNMYVKLRPKWDSHVMIGYILPNWRTYLDDNNIVYEKIGTYEAFPSIPKFRVTLAENEYVWHRYHFARACQTKFAQ
jgi:hypothetical protein